MGEGRVRMIRRHLETRAPRGRAFDAKRRGEEASKRRGQRPMGRTKEGKRQRCTVSGGGKGHRRSKEGQPANGRTGKSVAAYSS